MTLKPPSNIRDVAHSENVAQFCGNFSRASTPRLRRAAMVRAADPYLRLPHGRGTRRAARGLQEPTRFARVGP
jgi:hypothetical protein